MKILSLLPFVLYCIFIFTPCFAQEISGEIINVNPTTNSVFLDQGEDVVQKGDIFSIQGPNGPIYLEVVEVQSAVSKLAISNNPSFKASSGDFQFIRIGSELKRVFSLKAAITPTPGIPNIDPQVLVKPNIANETIQSLDSRLDKMVESNVKLFNGLTELLNEKKKWQSEADQTRTQLLQAQQQAQILTTTVNDLRKQLADANSQVAKAISDKEINKKQLDATQSKLDALKTRLDNLNKILQERLKQ